MTRTRKIILLIPAACALVGTAVLLRSGLGHNNSQITVGMLSERAQEFVETQRLDPASSWKSQQLQPVEAVAAAKPNQFQKTPCFSITIPLPIRTVYTIEQAECSIQVRLLSPAAKLTILVESFAKPMSEHSAVQLRETVVETYTLEPFVSEHFAVSKTFSDPDGVSFFAQLDGKLVVVVFSETNDQEKILSESLPKVLEALMIN